MTGANSNSPDQRRLDHSSTPSPAEPCTRWTALAHNQMHSLSRTYKRRSARVIELWGSDRPPGTGTEDTPRKEENENLDSKFKIASPSPSSPRSSTNLSRDLSGLTLHNVRGFEYAIKRPPPPKRRIDELFVVGLVDVRHTGAAFCDHGSRSSPLRHCITSVNVLRSPTISSTGNPSLS